MVVAARRRDRRPETGDRAPQAQIALKYRKERTSPFSPARSASGLPRRRRNWSLVTRHASPRRRRSSLRPPASRLRSPVPKAPPRHSSRVTRHRAEGAPVSRLRPPASGLPRRRRPRHSSRVTRHRAAGAPASRLPSPASGLPSPVPKAQLVTGHWSRVTRHCAPGAPPTLLIRLPYVAHTWSM